MQIGRNKSASRNFFVCVRVFLKQKIYILIDIHFHRVDFRKHDYFFFLALLLPGAPTHHSFTFNSRFFYGLKRKIYLSQSLCRIFHFRFRFVFIQVYIFVQLKVWTP